MKRSYGLAVAPAVAVFCATASLAMNQSNWIPAGTGGGADGARRSFQDHSDTGPAPQMLAASHSSLATVAAQVISGRAARSGDPFIAAEHYPGSGEASVGSELIAQAATDAEVSESGQSADQTALESNTRQRAASVLDHGEKLTAQHALAWFGDYNGKIDGIFGRGTRAAVQAFQRRNSIDPTGQLTRSQFDLLNYQHKKELEETGYETVEHEPAGIGIGIPTSMLEYSRTEVPFIYYDPTPGNRIQLFLISMPGSRIALEALFSLFQGFEFMPEGGSRSLERQRFIIESKNDLLNAFADVRLFENRIKGFLLLWHPVTDARVARIARSMSTGLQESSESTLSIPIDTDNIESNAFFAGLQIPRPKSRHTGFFIDSSGTVATGSSVAGNCADIILSPDQKMTVAAVGAEDGIALLTPVETQVPLVHARLRPSQPTRGAQVSVSGYSFGGELGAPSQSHGKWIGKDPTAGEQERYLIEAETYPGDVGGPVLDVTGAVVGIMRERISEGKTLPDGVQPLAPARAIASLAITIGKQAEYAFSGGKLESSDLNRTASDMTVLLDCYTD